MTKYLNKSFSVGMGGSKNHNIIFGGGIFFHPKQGRVKIIGDGIVNGVVKVQPYGFNNRAVGKSLFVKFSLLKRKGK